MTEVPYTEIVERTAILPDATLRVARYEWVEPIDQRWTSDDRGLLDLSLSRRPANARVCYEDKWRRTRFEPLGKVAFFPPQMAICARGDAGPGRVLRCRLPLVKVRISDGWSEDQLRASLNLKAPSILHTCARIVTELYEPGFAAPLLIESLCNTLAVDIVRYFTTLPPLRSDRGGLAPWRLKRIDERVAADGPPPSIDDLVSLCGLGRRHLIRSFKLSRQENIGDYVARIRLEKAKHMLAAHFNITEIASHLGFASLASFSTTFKRATGMAPRSYQRADFRPEKEKPA